MKFVREYTNGHGARFQVEVEIAETGPAIERAIQRLANKARGNRRMKATALDGAVRVSIRDLPPVAGS